MPSSSVKYRRLSSGAGSEQFRVAEVCHVLDPPGHDRIRNSPADCCAAAVSIDRSEPMASSVRPRSAHRRACSVFAQ